MLAATQHVWQLQQRRHSARFRWFRQAASASSEDQKDQGCTGKVNEGNSENKKEAKSEGIRRNQKEEGEIRDSVSKIGAWPVDQFCCHGPRSPLHGMDRRAASERIRENCHASKPREFGVKQLVKGQHSEHLEVGYPRCILGIIVSSKFLI